MNVFDHYWLADDGRLYSSAKQLMVSAADAGYVAWTGAGNVASAWPRDLAGEQTIEEMQNLLTPWGLFVDLPHYAESARNKTVVSDITVNGMPFATDPITVGSLNTAFIYTQAKTGETFSWKLPDGTWLTLDKADITALQNAVSAFGQSCFECEAIVIDGITAGTVTTHEQVDAAFAAVPNTFTSATTMAKRKPKK